MAITKANESARVWTPFGRTNARAGQAKPRAFIHQAFHYFARPHERALSAPHGGPSAWTAASVADEPWLIELNADARRECVDATRAALSSGRRARTLSRGDFYWPALTRALDREALVTGRGFFVVRGVPVERITEEEREAFFWGVGLTLGTPGAQNVDGDLVGHVRDTGDTEPGRLYRTAAHIRFHCDAADAVGLLCVNPAPEGGASLIASSIAIHDEIQRTRPDLASRMYAPFVLDSHGQRGLDYVYVPMARHALGRLRIFYHSDYFRTGAAKTSEGLDARTAELLDVFDGLAEDPRFALPLELQRGDMQFVSNHAIVHSRTAYRDGDTPETRRHLLRLWLSVEPAPSGIRARALHAKAWAGIVGAFAAGKARSQRA